VSLNLIFIFILILIFIHSNLSNNNLTSLSVFQSSSTHLKQLVHLDLSNNQISSLPSNQFQQLVQLRFLNLSGNLLSCDQQESARAFHNLPNLRQLILTNNRLGSLSPKLFVGATKLERVDLRGNNITSIGNNTFPPALQQLHLDSKSLLCDCKLAYFARWLRHHQTTTVNGTCFHPNELKGQSVSNLAAGQLKCG